MKWTINHMCGEFCSFQYWKGIPILKGDSQREPKAHPPPWGCPLNLFQSLNLNKYPVFGILLLNEVKNLICILSSIFKKRAFFDLFSIPTLTICPNEMNDKLCIFWVMFSPTLKGDWKGIEGECLIPLLYPYHSCIIEGGLKGDWRGMSNPLI